MIMPFERTINKNPELKRNFWLELSAPRLIAMPTIVLAIFLMVIAVSKDGVAMPLTFTGMAIFSILSGLWGTKLVIDSIIEEVNDRTWIQQQMTALTPWQMTLGKLFGSTSYAWYGGLMGLLMYLVGRSAGGSTAFAVYGTESPTMFQAIETVLIAIIGTIGIHAFAGMTAMLLVRKQTHKPKVSSTATYIFILVLMAYAYQIPFTLATLGSATWYGMEINRVHFQLVTALVFTSWAVVGMYRNMRTELQVTNGMGTWIGYMAFIAFYNAGFGFNPEIGKDLPMGVAAVYWATATLILMSVVLAFLEPKDAVNRRKLIVAWSERNWKRVSELMPLWMPTLALAVFLCVLSSLTQSILGSPHLRNMTTEGANVPFLLPLAVAAFLVRDVAFVMLINSTGKRKAPDAAAFVYLMLAHIVLPAIVSVGQDKAGLWLFMPTIEGKSLLSFLAGSIEAGILVAWLLRVWRMRNEELEARFAAA